jgi:hypothetical protein
MDDRLECEISPSRICVVFECYVTYMHLVLDFRQKHAGRASGNESWFNQPEHPRAVQKVDSPIPQVKLFK